MFLCLIFYYTYSFFCSFLLRNAPIITLFVHLHDALYSFLHLFSSWDCAYYRFVCTPPRPLYTTLFVCPNNMSAIIYTKPGSRNDIFCNVSSTAFFPPFASFLLSPYFRSVQYFLFIYTHHLPPFRQTENSFEFPKAKIYLAVGYLCQRILFFLRI